MSPFLVTLSQLLWGRYSANRTHDVDDTAFTLFCAWATPSMSDGELRQLSDRSFEAAKIWLKTRNENVAPL
jgi:hypothetical protein